MNALTYSLADGWKEANIIHTDFAAFNHGPPGKSPEYARDLVLGIQGKTTYVVVTSAKRAPVTHEFRVEVDIADGISEIYVRDVPALTELLAKYSTIIEAEIATHKALEDYE